MKNKKVIDLQQKIEEQQETLEGFRDSDIDDLTVKTMGIMAKTINGLRVNNQELFNLLKIAIEAINQNQRRIEQLEDENENADVSSDIATLQDEIKGIKTEIYYMRDELK